MKRPEQEILVSRIRELSHPLEPIATDTPPRLDTLAGVRVVLFDVYGTLVISGSGDVGTSSSAGNGELAAEALAAAGLDGGLNADLDAAGTRYVDLFLAGIHARHKALREQGVEHPEIDARELAAEALLQLRREQLIDEGEGKDGGGEKGTSATLAARVALEYECRVNPVWPMPGLTDVLRTLRDAGLRLGTVSNAQYYTPLLLEAFLDGGLPGAGIDPALCVWSCDLLEAKPSVRLYERALALLRTEGTRGGSENIEPGEVVFVGNDIRNDIRPAAAVGLRTVLFAGDRRSLRLREDDPGCADVIPDAIITHLDQLPALLA